ncbi:hypothetical protein HWV62_1270 [Athelia sp. TMB]|nr:hypothetical protein HWV62_1270 [Athelia sp. TMB]
MSQSVIFHLHGRDPTKDGVVLSVDPSVPLDKIQKEVAEKLTILDPKRITFCASGKPEALAGDLKVLDSPQAVANERTVAILIDGRKPRPVPGPDGGLPFIGGYSEIYPDFLGNYQRLLDKYGHLVHVHYMYAHLNSVVTRANQHSQQGKKRISDRRPRHAGHVLSEGEFFSKDITEDHPLFPLKLSNPTGLFTADSSMPEWSQSHQLLMTAMSAKAMRGYVKIMDHSSKKLTNNVIGKFAEDDKSFDVFPFMLRAAAQTIGEVVIGQDFGMLDSTSSDIAEIFKKINQGLHLSQALARKGKWYRAIPNPEAREQVSIKKWSDGYLDNLAEEGLKTGHEDMPYTEAATKTDSILDFMLHALDGQGKKLSRALLIDDAATFLGAGQVTTSSALSWILYTLSHHKPQAEKLYQSILDLDLTIDSEITADHISKMEYLDWFIKETQRLYNPAFQPTRLSHKELILPGGFILPKNSQVTVALHSVHVNKEHWKDPFTFIPERWGTDEVKKRHKNAYIPFATGARGCIGFNFALQEMKIVISRLVLNFSFEDVTDGAVVYDPSFSLYRPLNFKAKAHRRPDPATRPKVDKVEETAQEPQAPDVTPKVGQRDLPTLYVLYGSNNGSSEGFASDLVSRARKLGFADIQKTTLDQSILMSEDTLPKQAEKALVLIVCCSYNGEAPDNALNFDSLLDQAIAKNADNRFTNVNFAVFGTGNKQWGPTYQKIPKKIDTTLATFGGHRFFELGAGDASADQEGDFSTWSTKLWANVSSSLGLDSTNKDQGNSLIDPVASTASAVTLKYVKAGTAALTPTPPVDGMALARVQSNEELVDQDSPMPRAMRLVTFTLPEGQNYRAGDHVEIFPENEKHSVDKLIGLLGLVEQALFEVQEVDLSIVNSKSLAALLKGRGPLTIREVLTSYADLSGPVSRYGLQTISATLPADEEHAALKKELAEVSAPSYDASQYEAFAKKNRNFVLLCENYPLITKSLELPQILTAMTCTQPRRYSIASSPLAHPDTVSVCIGVVHEIVPISGRDFEGLSSGFLKRAEPGQEIWARTRAAQETFHLPEDPKVPVIMEHRRALGLKETSEGGESTTRLYYGVSYHDMSSLRRTITDHVNAGHMTGRAVYSEDKEVRRYAQELLLQDAVEIWNLIESGAHIYVCGSAIRLGAGVRKAITQIARQVGAVDDPDSFVPWMIKNGRFSEDVFG